IIVALRHAYGSTLFVTLMKGTTSCKALVVPLARCVSVIRCARIVISWLTFLVGLRTSPCPVWTAPHSMNLEKPSRIDMAQRVPFHVAIQVQPTLFLNRIPIEPAHRPRIIGTIGGQVQ